MSVIVQRLSMRALRVFCWSFLARNTRRTYILPPDLLFFLCPQIKIVNIVVLSSCLSSDCVCSVGSNTSSSSVHPQYMSERSRRQVSSPVRKSRGHVVYEPRLSTTFLCASWTCCKCFHGSSRGHTHLDPGPMVPAATTATAAKIFVVATAATGVGGSPRLQ